MLRIACLLLWFLALPVFAAPVAVPDPLQPWRGWALEDDHFRDCTLLANRAGGDAGDYLCAWPGPLQVDADANGAQFALRMQVQAETWVPLPGDGENWPQAVRVDGASRPVIERDGYPRLRLEPGDHRIEGHFEWTRRPQALAVPMAFGIVRLQVDGAAIAPVRHENGALVLGRTASEAPEADSLTLRVYRRLADGVPAMLETSIEIAASGQAREEVFGPVLPAGFVPTSLTVDAGWPARLEPDGRLRVQVQPASTVVRVFARAVAPLDKVTMAKVAPPWPAQEVWSYEAAPALRITNATGPAQVDPAQAGVPEGWRAFPAFALDPGGVLAIELRSRGLGSDQANRLQLQRQAWLDFSGAGWTFHDLVSGTMRQGWRLDALPPYRLEQARDLAEDEPLLVTEGADGATGVEWRTNPVRLSAGLRMQPAHSRIAVTGWKQTFDAVNVTLHLPFGYRLLAAPGADRAAGSWVDRWTLLDIFLVAVLALFAWHALGRAAAAATLAYLLVAFHEPGAPLLWLGAVFALGLVLRFLPAGRLHWLGKWVRRGALLVTVLIALPFAATQLRQALYPQLEPSTGGAAYGYGGEEGNVAMLEIPQAQMANAPPPPASPAPTMRDRMQAESKVASDAASEAVQQELDSIVVTGSRLRKADVLDRYSKNTIVQTGRGLPTWQHGHSYQLAWSGPVTADQQVRLWLSPPWLTRTLRVLCVGLLAWLLLRLANVDFPLSGATRRAGASPRVPLAAAASLALALLASPVRAAEGPDPTLLAELKARLTRPPACAPHCADIAAAQVVADGQRLEVALDVHAGTRTAVPLPMDSEALSVESLRVDGAETAGVRLDVCAPKLTVVRGVVRVLLASPFSGDRVALAFPLMPRRIDFQGEGWQAGGISEGRLLTETLGLSRVREAQADNARGPAAQEFPPYVRVERTLTLGLDWTVRTRVIRIAPAEGGFSVDVPLLPGEKVLTAGLRVREGRIEVPVPDGASEVAWESNLDKADTIAVQAPGLGERAEVWRVLVSPLWRAAFSGVPESVPAVESNDWHEFTFHPLPGESLAIAVARPAPVAGATQAILDVQLRTDVGQRASEHTLDFNLRASQGGERVLTLPAGSELLSVQRDGTPVSLRLDDGKLSLSVSPGSQHYSVRFRDAGHAALHNTTPKVGFGLPTANIGLDLGLPESRWVLFTHGPRVGPAVLYWGELAVLLLVAFGLSRLHWTPLKLHEWLLLGIGFSTVSWFALAVVVGWLFAMAWRERQGAASTESKLVFDAGQILLVGLTLTAVLALLVSIQNGLLGRPDMHIVSPEPGSTPLHWFADQSADALPVAGAISVPMWVYRIAMLAWALWLAMAVLRWMKWALKAWTAGGWWRPLRTPKAVPPPRPVDPDATPPPPADESMP
jgi:hypothetical protein